MEQSPSQKINSPVIHTSLAVETMDAFALRKLNPLQFNKQELKALYYRFFKEFDTFTIYFLQEAIEEKYGYPQFLREVGQQLISYERFNLFIIPRGFSKSTNISCAFPIRETVYQMKQYIVIVSETMDIAADFTETIRFELEQNERLEQFYGKFRSHKEFDESISKFDSTEKWTIADIVCKSISRTTGKPFYTRIRARGAGQQIRGKKYHHSRPDLLIFDDFESRSNTDTIQQRLKNTRWFNRDALKIMDRYDSVTGKGQVIVAGTIVHEESRLNRLKKVTDEAIINGKEPIWKMQYRQAAADPNTFENPLWPPRFGEEWLRKERDLAIANDDIGGYLQELFNIPVTEELRKFKDIYFSQRYNTIKLENYYGNLVLIYEGKKYPVTLSAGLDLGGWEDKGSDYTGLAVNACIYDYYKDIYQGFCLEAYNERWDPSKIIEVMFDVSHRYNFVNDYNTEHLRIPWTVETNAFQTLLYHFLQREARRIADFSVNIAYEQHESKNKAGRILSLVPVFKSRFYMFGEHLSWLARRFCDYGISPDMHDDIEDAFEKAHRNLVYPAKDTSIKLQRISPIIRKIKPVEPVPIIEGSWLSL
jgi:hypothetical protein